MDKKWSDDGDAFTALHDGNNSNGTKLGSTTRQLFELFGATAMFALTPLRSTNQAFLWICLFQMGPKLMFLKFFTLMDTSLT